ncbi:Alpha-ketoglutarate permease (plasmid) [Klebsiella aerogenes]|nr:Alpha-ketoglutarate permease [Klebsiella aerogenes]
MTESSINEQGSLEQGDTRRRVWAIVGASSGNLVEWFDFYVYSFCSLYFAHIFFPSGIPPLNCYKRPEFLLLAS